MPKRVNWAFAILGKQKIATIRISKYFFIIVSFFVLKITFLQKRTKFIDKSKFFALKMQNKAIFAKIATLSVARATKVARPPSHRVCVIW